MTNDIDLRNFRNTFEIVIPAKLRRNYLIYLYFIYIELGQTISDPAGLRPLKNQCLIL